MGFGAGLSGAGSGAAAGAAFGPWGAAIGAGVGFVGGLLGSRKSESQKTAEKLHPDVLKALNTNAGAHDETSNQYGAIALPAIKNAGAYYNSILDPNNTNAINAVLGPERIALTEGAHSGILKQVAEFAPRGGGRVATQAQALPQLNRSLIELVAKARGGAAQGLLSVGGTAGNLSSAFAGLSANERQAVLAAIQDIITGGNKQRNQSGAFAAGAAKDIGGLIADIISKTKGGRGGGGNDPNGTIGD